MDKARKILRSSDGDSLESSQYTVNLKKVTDNVVLVL